MIGFSNEASNWSLLQSCIFLIGFHYSLTAKIWRFGSVHIFMKGRRPVRSSEYKHNYRNKLSMTREQYGLVHCTCAPEKRWLLLDASRVRTTPAMPRMLRTNVNAQKNDTNRQGDHKYGKICTDKVPWQQFPLDFRRHFRQYTRSLSVLYEPIKKVLFRR